MFLLWRQVIMRLDPTKTNKHAVTLWNLSCEICTPSSPYMWQAVVCTSECKAISLSVPPPPPPSPLPPSHFLHTQTKAVSLGKGLSHSCVFADLAPAWKRTLNSPERLFTNCTVSSPRWHARRLICSKQHSVRSPKHTSRSFTQKRQNETKRKLHHMSSVNGSGLTSKREIGLLHKVSFHLLSDFSLINILQPIFYIKKTAEITNYINTFAEF